METKISPDCLRSEMSEYGITLEMVRKKTIALGLGPKGEGFSYHYIRRVISIRDRHNEDILSIATKLVDAVKATYECAA